MKNWVIILVQVFFVCESFCQNINRDSLNRSIDIDNWKKTPYIAGRVATNMDVEKGIASFYKEISDSIFHIPTKEKLPFLGYQHKTFCSKKELVVVIQAEIIGLDTLYGTRLFSGKYSSCWANEFNRIYEQDEAIRIYRNNQLLKQKNSELKLFNNDFIVTIEYYPSFHTNCRVVISKNQDINSIELISLKGTDNGYNPKPFDFEIDEYLEVSSKELLLNTCYEISDYEIPIWKKSIERQIVDDSTFIQLEEYLDKQDILNHGNMGLMPMIDGMLVFFKYESDLGKNVFCFGGITQNDTIAQKFLRNLCEYYSKTLKNPESIEYLEFNECIERLPVRKINNTPLEYRFKKMIFNHEKDTLTYILSQIPQNKNIIFNCNYVQWMDESIIELLENYIKRNSKINLLCYKRKYPINKRGYNIYELIHIPENRLFFDREELISSMKSNKP